MTTTSNMDNNIQTNNQQTLLSLQTEWQVLHLGHEKYEYLALIIKLFAIAVCISSFYFSSALIITLSFILILWLQEGILKTFQARTCSRIESIESAISHLSLGEQTTIIPFQFYNDWLKTRPSTLGLVLEYIKSALRPTVAYPYVVLVFISLCTQVSL